MQLNSNVGVTAKPKVLLDSLIYSAHKWGPTNGQGANSGAGEWPRIVHGTLPRTTHGSEPLPSTPDPDTFSITTGQQLGALVNITAV